MLDLAAINTVSALEIDPNQIFDNIGEAASFALTSSLFGLAIVFGVLALLWGILELFRLFFDKTPKKAKPVEAPKSVEKVEPTPVPTEVAVTNNASSDEELVAAITAAISAFRSEKGVAGGFRVVSFKKR